VWGWDPAVLGAAACAGHPGTLCGADTGWWVGSDITREMEHTEGRTP